jgi:hypothetical protein
MEKNYLLSDFILVPFIMSIETMNTEEVPNQNYCVKNDFFNNCSYLTNWLYQSIGFYVVKRMAIRECIYLKTFF